MFGASPRHHGLTSLASTHQFPLVTEAESADGPQGGRAEPRGAVQDVLVPEAGLPVAALLPQQQHVGQVRDVAGGQAQRLDLGQPPVGRLGGDERAQRRESRVDAVRAVPLPCVGGLPLLAHAAETSLSPASSPRIGVASPLPPPPGRSAPHRAFRLCAGAADSGAVAVRFVRVGGEAVGLPACRPHPGTAPVRSGRLETCGCSAAAAHHFILRVKIACGGRAAAADPVTEGVWAVRPPQQNRIPFPVNDGCFLGRLPATEKGRQVGRTRRRRGHLLWSGG